MRESLRSSFKTGQLSSKQLRRSPLPFQDRLKPRAAEEYEELASARVGSKQQQLLLRHKQQSTMSQMPLDKPQKRVDPQSLDFLNEIINS